MIRYAASYGLPQRTKWSKLNMDEGPPPCKATGSERLFFLIGAPGPQTFDLFKKHVEVYGRNTRFVVCADLTTFRNCIAECGKPEGRETIDGQEYLLYPKFNVFNKHPTNFRAHYDTLAGNCWAKQGGVTINSLEAFRQAQRNVSISLKNCMDLAKQRRIDTFFAIVPRKKRPTHISVGPDGELQGGGDLGSAPKVDAQLSWIIL